MDDRAEAPRPVRAAKTLTSGDPTKGLSADKAESEPIALHQNGASPDRCWAADGVHDAEIMMGAHGGEVIHVWVRENPDPAYLITPSGWEWTVIDNIRHRVLGRLPSLPAALNFIRPVLPADLAGD